MGGDASVNNTVTDSDLLRRKLIWKCYENALQRIMLYDPAKEKLANYDKQPTPVGQWCSRRLLEMERAEKEVEFDYPMGLLTPGYIGSEGK